MARSIPFGARLLPGLRGGLRVLRNDLNGVTVHSTLRTPPPFRRGAVTPVGGHLARGQAALDGEFHHFGQSLVVAPDALWTTPLPSERFAGWLHGFDWFGDMAALSDSPTVASRAGEYVDYWIAEYGRYNRFAWQPAILARRAYAWLLHWDPLLVETAPHRRRSMIRQVRYLLRTRHRLPPGMPQLYAHIVFALLSFRVGREDLLIYAQNNLGRVLGEQVLPDGAHISRSPETTLEVLRILMGLDDLFDQHGIVPSLAHIRAMDRLAPMLAFFTHTDGGLAAFQGGGEGDRSLLAAVTAPLNGRPFTYAPHARYQRMERGHTRVIMDVGGPAPFPSDGKAHLAPLAFEMSAPCGRIVVNCGWSPAQPDSWREAVRRTPAHSTLAIDGRDAGRFGDPDDIATPYAGSPVTRGPGQVHVERREADQGIVIEATHAGYVPTFGRVHTRRLFLAEHGGDLRGEDTLRVPAGHMSALHAPRRAQLRFHLHPDVRVRPPSDDRRLELAVEDQTWAFLLGGSAASLSVEESAYLATGARPQPTRQIVVSAPVHDDQELRLAWAFKLRSDDKTVLPRA